MKRSIIFTFLLACAVVLQAQQFTVTEFHADSSDMDAMQFPSTDFNGDTCGLIKLDLALKDVVFEGDIISSTFKGNSWWIYMPKRSNWLTIKSKTNTYLPLRCEFKDYGIKGIHGSVTYVMAVEIPQIKNDDYGQEPVSIKVESDSTYQANTPRGARQSPSNAEYVNSRQSRPNSHLSSSGVHNPLSSDYYNRSTSHLSTTTVSKPANSGSYNNSSSNSSSSSINKSSNSGRYEKSGSRPSVSNVRRSTSTNNYDRSGSSSFRNHNTSSVSSGSRNSSSNVNRSSSIRSSGYNGSARSSSRGSSGFRSTSRGGSSSYSRGRR